MKLTSVFRNCRRPSSVFPSRLYSMNSPRPKRKYAVLIAGHVPPSIAAGYGDYGILLTNLLKTSDDTEEWKSFKVVDEEFPSDEDLKEIDAIVISGSKHDAHADLPWIQKLKELIVQFSQDSRKKIVGICFGHQLAAIAFGGDSGRSPCGWEAGVKNIRTSTLFEEKFKSQTSLGTSFRLLEIHRDQVLKLPENAVLLASSENTPIEMFSVNDNVLCVQGHPEFDEKLVEELIRSRADSGVIPQDVAVDALASLKNGTDNDSIRTLLQSFIHN
jgi:GMP synthase-like glutamine amidotransferase